jgi:hypothetical protein
MVAIVYMMRNPEKRRRFADRLDQPRWTPETGGVAEPDARHGAARKFASVVTQASLILELE